VDVHIPLNVEKRLASRLYCCILLLDKIETTILYLHNEIKLMKYLKQMKQMKSYKCTECNELITNETIQYNAMYRCCDAHVCSLTCSRMRYGKILSVDPNLNNPIVWQTIPDIGLNTSNLKRSKSLPKLDMNYSIINIASLETITESNICECDMRENDYTYQTFAASIILMIIEGIINIIDVIIKIFY
jgi:hypothetical protein